MTKFQELLKSNLEKEGLDFDVGWGIYNSVFKLTYNTIKNKTHKHRLLEDKLVISIPYFGHFLTTTTDNEKQYQQHLKYIIEEQNE